MGELFALPTAYSFIFIIILTMANSLVKNDVHLVFHVKQTSRRIREEDLQKLFAYLGGIIRQLKGIAIEIGGRPDHVHLLTSVPPTMALADFIRIIKSRSSKWLKTLDRSYASFAWQDGYGAFSVSPTLLDKTSSYIRNQADHHKQRSFGEEYRLFLQVYGIICDERYIDSD